MGFIRVLVFLLFPLHKIKYYYFPTIVFPMDLLRCNFLLEIIGSLIKLFRIMWGCRVSMKTTEEKRLHAFLLIDLK